MIVIAAHEINKHLINKVSDHGPERRVRIKRRSLQVMIRGSVQRLSLKAMLKGSVQRRPMCLKTPRIK